MDSNLLAKNDAAEVDTSVVKISILAVLNIAVSASFGYFTSTLLKTSGAGVFALTAASALLFIIFFFLQSLFVKGRTLNLFIILGETVALSLFFLINNYSFIMIIAAVLVYLSLYSALKKGKGELENQLNIRVIKIARVSVPKIIVSLAIIISAAYSQPFYPNHIIISKELINTIMGPSEALIKLAHTYLPAIPNNFSVNMTLPQIAQENGLSLPILQEQVNSWGVRMSDGDTVLDATYSYVNGKVVSLSQGIKWALFGAMFLLIFLTIKGLFWMFYWLIYLFIFLFYEISMALGFSKTSYQQISKEIIIL